jgi:hypothetical protein
MGINTPSTTGSIPKCGPSAGTHLFQTILNASNDVSNDLGLSSRPVVIPVLDEAEAAEFRSILLGMSSLGPRQAASVVDAAAKAVESHGLVLKGAAVDVFTELAAHTGAQATRDSFDGR